MQNKKDIFVSHSSQDKGVTGALCEALSSYGVSYWFSSGKDRTINGEQWSDEISGALNAADHVLFVASEESLTSTYVREEIQTALKQNKKIYIFSLENEKKILHLLDASFPQLKKTQIHYANAVGRTHNRDHFDESAKEIATLLNRRQTAKNLKRLGAFCLSSLVLIYSWALIGKAGSAFREISESLKSAPVATVISTSQKPAVSRSDNRKKDVVVAAPVLAPGGAVAAAPIAVAKSFQVPRFVMASIPLRSRLVGNWSVDGAELKMSFQLAYQSGNLTGQVTVHNKNGSEGCQFQVLSKKLEGNYVTLIPQKNSGTCSAKVIHLGYRNEEKIQVLIEGGSLNLSSLFREI